MLYDGHIKCFGNTRRRYLRTAGIFSVGRMAIFAHRVSNVTWGRHLKYESTSIVIWVDVLVGAYFTAYVVALNVYFRKPSTQSRNNVNQRTVANIRSFDKVK